MQFILEPNIEQKAQGLVLLVLASRIRPWGLGKSWDNHEFQLVPKKRGSFHLMGRLKLNQDIKFWFR